MRFIFTGAIGMLLVFTHNCSAGGVDGQAHLEALIQNKKLSTIQMFLPAYVKTGSLTVKALGDFALAVPKGAIRDYFEQQEKYYKEKIAQAVTAIVTSNIPNLEARLREIPVTACSEDDITLVQLAVSLKKGRAHDYLRDHYPKEFNEAGAEMPKMVIRKDGREDKRKNGVRRSRRGIRNGSNS